MVDITACAYTQNIGRILSFYNYYGAQKILRAIWLIICYHG